MRQNVPRPVHFGTMKRPGMNLSRAKYVVAFAILFFKNRKVEVFAQHQQICSNWTAIPNRNHNIGTSYADELRYACQAFHKTVKDIHV